MKGRLSDKVRLQHILDAITEIETYLEGVSFPSPEGLSNVIKLRKKRRSF